MDENESSTGQSPHASDPHQLKFHNPRSCKEQQHQASEACVCSLVAAKSHTLEGMRATVQTMGKHAKAQPQLHTDA